MPDGTFLSHTTVPLLQLRPHPDNADIYGDPRTSQDFDAFIQACAVHGITPLTVADDWTIIGGHRRYYAALALELETVSVNVYHYASALEQLAALLTDNYTRIKSHWQLANEANAYLTIEATRAKQRQGARTDLLPNTPEETAVPSREAPGPNIEETFPQSGQTPGPEASGPNIEAPVPQSKKTRGPQARDAVGKKLGVSGRTVENLVTVTAAVEHLQQADQPEAAAQLQQTLEKSISQAAQAARQVFSPSALPLGLPLQEASAPARVALSVEDWERAPDAQQQAWLAAHGAAQSHFNRQTTDNVEWARWSWNPVTGCLHNCAYCYARDIAQTMYSQFDAAARFTPRFHPDRLAAPRCTKPPQGDAADALRQMGLRNVFVCSMADLFGKWVPTAWIEAVLAQVRTYPQWNFLFLTKFPQRLAEFTYPQNTWIGTTVDTQAAVERAEKAFRKVRTAGYGGIAWLSCEPLMECVTFSSLEMFDWVVMGGASKSTQTPEFRPPFPWIVHLWNQAKAAGLPVYMKTNLFLADRHKEAIPVPNRVCEYPAAAAGGDRSAHGGL